MNIHLLIDPADPAHEKEVAKALGQLYVTYDRQKFGCTNEDLAALGRAYRHDPTLSEPAAIEQGYHQFRPSLAVIRTWYDDTKWVRENCLVAVSGAGDGTGGIKEEGAQAHREEIERFADIILTSNARNRDFWLGRGAADGDHSARYGWAKPCLHGCDAHRLDAVLNPKDDRRCWIRAEPTFAGLRQVKLEPSTRVSIGAAPPAQPADADVISAVHVTGAPWLGVQAIALNSGLVAVVGAKGSGKTALADMIAYAAGACAGDEGETSFLGRAKEHLGGLEITLEWASREKSSRRFDARARVSPAPRVRYLSQQFVQRLSSHLPSGRDELKEELERVVFESLPMDARLGATDLAELVSLRTRGIQNVVAQLIEEIASVSAELQKRDDANAALNTEAARLAASEQRIAALEADEATLHAKAPATAGLSTELQLALEEHEAAAVAIATLKRRREALHGLAQAVQAQTRQFAKTRMDLEQEFAEAELQPEQWQQFVPAFPEVVTEILRLATAGTDGEIAEKNGPMPVAEGPPGVQGSLNEIDARVAALKKRAQIEGQAARRLDTTRKELLAERRRRDASRKHIEDTKKAFEARGQFVERRRRAYAEIFDRLGEQGAVLADLYAPLRAVLQNHGEGAGIDVAIERNVDIESWLADGAELFDFRRREPLASEDEFRRVARAHLYEPWRAGDAEEVSAAMRVFVEQALKVSAIKTQLRDGRTLHDLARWLYSTDHISLAYKIRYGDQPLEQLSPGMRGLALLVLYLSVDTWDTRPLVIDQPEDNLDPRSIQRQLMPFFRQSRTRRQVILVTHNPNLVVNGDADQVIVAESTRQVTSAMPTIRYAAGGLESREVRSDVCRVLEGGELAFAERERRYAIGSEKPPKDA